ncbi:hypothetical protein N9M41_08235 [Rhodopirellula sp.]|nr:hypothetical protein [Rhodopirellula sp.]
MVVPAGLVDNWRRELNETFHLDFEVFGSQGDVTDRKSNVCPRNYPGSEVVRNEATCGRRTASLTISNAVG